MTDSPSSRGVPSPVDFAAFMSASAFRKPLSAANPARWMHERVVQSINAFEQGLDPDQEVGARLVSFGPDFVFHVEDVGYWGPDIITFYGVDNLGKRVELLQHISQLNVLLVAVDKQQAEARRIGFGLVKRLEEENGR